MSSQNAAFLVLIAITVVAGGITLALSGSVFLAAFASGSVLFILNKLTS